ncbi:MAG: hypothetical protein CFH21_00496 [Alphaproteobacteria bacterium MarineAlpha5_Bin11]|nr:hypothetical protein [Pelagibacteraceae bacterium]PPR44092.1 MAG: hypothetical protein CFH21_00496 [Alphaproteobacteria bacterium MarineAlpha5_Bin11]PPR51595.1 MAG: hypothetical protein CFH20_00524 [Alphaproteobacteria bacterium MarineAlpha5_Bin10]|tara:strand:+ start:3205 stop:3981 length:777 start_codon:yes stop_codon:yes gene_type:complete
MKNIVDTKLHPISTSIDYINDCKKKLESNSILKLDNFLLPNILQDIQNEANLLHTKAYYCSQKHTILLNKKSDSFEVNDPCNIELKSDKGCVPHDLIPKKSELRKLYESTEFVRFIENVLGINKIYPYKDTLSSINYNYYEKGQELGWHFDNASFAVTLMIQSSDSGGVFQYVSKGRDFDRNIVDKDLISSIFNGSYPVNKLSANPGTLILFYGRNYLHRVTPVTSKKCRILVTLNYNLEEGVELSENARLTFFGRLK